MKNFRDAGTLLMVSAAIVLVAFVQPKIRNRRQTVQTHAKNNQATQISDQEISESGIADIEPIDLDASDFSSTSTI